MAEPSSEARIRDLKRRLELDPTSRLFVSLAEEYRKAGRTADALITLQGGLKSHPGYLSAQVALGRAYLEAGNISEAIATFTKVLTVDPGNLVAAKSLADIFLSRGESVEAIKKYKLYRALSGDRTVDDIVQRLEKEIAPPAPPTFFDAPPAALVEDPSLRPTDRLDSSQATARQQPQAPALALALAAEEPPAEPQGRALGDLYFAQGHYAEALRIYDELVAVYPFDEELKRLRRDAEARLLPAGAQPGAAASEPALQRRLARIRTLKEWLSVVQAG